MASVNAQQHWTHRLSGPAQTGRELLCFAHAGGAAGYFRPLATALSGRADVVAVQYPGRQERRREPPATSIAELAGAVAGILGAEPPRPRILFGHSMGALVAFEVVRRLPPEHAEAVRHLVVSGRRAPSRYRAENLHTRGDKALLAELRTLGGTDGALLDEPEIVEMIMPAIRADYRSVETYRHQPGTTVACPVTAVVGDTDPRVDTDEARAWSEHTTGAFDLRVFPGGHFYLQDNVAGVGELLAGIVRAAG